jgi:prophage regulatory protein
LRQNTRPKRIYRYADLKPAGVPFTRKHINTLESRDEFPRRVHLTSFSIGWVAEEVDRWVEEKIRRCSIQGVHGGACPENRAGR